MQLIDSNSVFEIYKVLYLFSLSYLMVEKSESLFYISYSLMHNWHTSFFIMPVMLILDRCEDG